MSSLQQSLEARRAPEPDRAALTATALPALRVTTWSGEEWVLPWSHFVSARLAEGRLELTFVSCAVDVEGDHLDALLADLAAFRLGLLRERPAAYRSQAAEGEPYITRLAVRPETRDASR